MKKFTLGFVLLLVLCSMMVFLPETNIVKASGTIYIRADGSVEGTDKITNANNIIYTFTESINDSIVVERSSIMIDGKGHTLNGSGSVVYGFNLTSVTNVMIKNVNIVGFGYGIYLQSSTLNVISDNNITENNVAGVWLHNSSNNTLGGNNITANKEGILMDEESNSNKLQNNSLNGNEKNLNLVFASNLSTNDIDESNTINGKPVYYWINRQNVEVPPNAGYIALINCTGITVNNQHLSNNQEGILIVGTTNSTIANNTFSNNSWGIVCFSSGNIIAENNVTNNNSRGIYIKGASNNTITGNYITANEGDGIRLRECSDNIISGNDLTNNNKGIYLYNAPDNIIVGNQIKDNDIGLSFNAIAYVSTSGNLIYHNNLINNTQQVVYNVLFAPAIVNTWDNGVEGNYWSDYEERYPNATEIDDSGIWDTPYVIDENNQDNYPLVPEFPIWIPMLIMFIVLTVAIVIYKRRTTQNTNSLTIKSDVSPKFY